MLLQPQLNKFSIIEEVFCDNLKVSQRYKKFQLDSNYTLFNFLV